MNAMALLVTYNVIISMPVILVHYPLHSRFAAVSDECVGFNIPLDT